MLLVHPIVIFDLETTGLWKLKDKIIEIAMIRLDPDFTRKEYRQYVNPGYGISIPRSVQELTGISNEQVQSSDLFSVVAQEIVDFIGDANLAGFNVSGFDIPVLCREFEDANIEFVMKGRKVIDASKVYHLNEKRDLSSAYSLYCGKNLKHSHSAMADTKATLEVLEAQTERYSGKDPHVESLLAYEYENKELFYDCSRRFRWWNNKLYIAFGVHAGKYTLQDLVASKSGYLKWILSSDFDADTKHLILDALNGKFPKCPVNE